jgi:hypothetical protein
VHRETEVSGGIVFPHVPEISPVAADNRESGPERGVEAGCGDEDVDIASFASCDDAVGSDFVDGIEDRLDVGAL